MTAIPNIKDIGEGRRVWKVPVIENLYILGTEVRGRMLNVWDSIKSFHDCKVNITIYKL